jgi:hypothetical protein
LQSDGGANPGLTKSVAVACELLLTCGLYLPIANGYLWTVKALEVQQQKGLPEACMKVFSKLAMRERRTRLKNVNVVTFEQNKEGFGTNRPLGLPCTVTFSGLIESLQLCEEV